MPEEDVIARLARIEANMATKADLANLVTKTDLAEAIAGVARNVDVTALGRLAEQQGDDLAGLKDDVSALTVIVQRLDNSHTRLLTGIRATHSRVSLLADRVGGFDERFSRLEDDRP